jgi:hypothetical protein
MIGSGETEVFGEKPTPCSAKRGLYTNIQFLPRNEHNPSQITQPVAIVQRNVRSLLTEPYKTRKCTLQKKCRIFA